MAGRIRTVKPEWLDDQKLISCSCGARLLSIALILLSDDYGRGRASHSYILSHVFPTIEDGPRVAEYMAELESTGFFFTYEVRNQTYFCIRNWKRHQRVDKPGKPLVPPPEDIEPPIPEVSTAANRKSVYFIRGATTGLIKIGESIDPIARLTELAKCGSEQLQLLVVVANGSRTERELHAKLSQHRVHGEWFRPSAEVLEELSVLGGKITEPIATAGYDGANRIRESFSNDYENSRERLLPDHDQRPTTNDQENCRERDSENEKLASCPVKQNRKQKADKPVATTCPESIEPTEATLSVATATGRNWRQDFVSMRDWALAKGERKVDWQAALRGWMRRASESPGKFASSPGRQFTPPQPNDERNRYVPPRIIR